MIVIVFDPLAVALIIAFNGLIETKYQKRSRLLGEIVENDEKLGLYDNLDDLMYENYKNYEVYGDKKEDLVENEPIIEQIEEPKVVEQSPKNVWEEPGFDWENRSSWVNNPAAVRFWMKNGGSIAKYNSIFRKYIKNDMDNDDLTKTY